MLNKFLIAISLASAGSIGAHDEPRIFSSATYETNSPRNGLMPDPAVFNRANEHNDRSLVTTDHISRITAALGTLGSNPNPNRRATQPSVNNSPTTPVFTTPTQLGNGTLTLQLRPRPTCARNLTLVFNQIPVTPQTAPQNGANQQPATRQ